LHLDKNTVVVLTSDNGAWFEGSNNPLRDRKGGPGYDGGYRVPFIAWAPAIIKPGKTGAILSGIDLLPTFVSMAGLSLPRNLEIDGKDISGVLTKGEPSPHDGIFLFNNEDIVGVRTQKWKYVTQTTYRGLTIPLEAVGFPELYDMSRDIAENYSVAATYPDTVKAMQDRIKKGQAYYASFKKGIPEAILKKKQEMHKSGKQD
jgi:arylsulfatase A-like enzyme